MKIHKSVYLLAVIFIVIFSFNYFYIYNPMSNLIESDDRNNGIEISAHYSYYVNPNSLSIDIRDVSPSKSPADVFRVLLQFSSKMKDKSFDSILLQSNGNTKFTLDGRYFKKLGMEYGTQNPVYTMRTFTQNVYTPDGKKAFGTWTGGWLGVMTKQMTDFSEFHKQWYVEDM